MIKYSYLRNERQVPVVCVAFELDDTGRKVNFSYSCCHSSDYFEKSKARMICNNRLQNERSKFTAELANPGIYNALQLIYTRLSNEERGTVGKMAKRWLKENPPREADANPRDFVV